MVRACGIAAASALPALAGVIMSFSPRTSVTGAVIRAAATLHLRRRANVRKARTCASPWDQLSPYVSLNWLGAANRFTRRVPMRPTNRDVTQMRLGLVARTELAGGPRRHFVNQGD